MGQRKFVITPELALQIWYECSFALGHNLIECTHSEPGVQYYIKNKLLKVRFPIPSKNVVVVHIEKRSKNVDTPLIHLIHISFRCSHMDDNIITKRTPVPLIKKIEAAEEYLCLKRNGLLV